MFRAIKQTVRVQVGGKVELVCSALAEGAQAEVIVLVSDNVLASGECVGLLADEVKILDQIVADAMSARACR